MSERTNPYTRMDLVQPLIAYGNTVEAMGLEPNLMELVKLRASQLNGCARCLHYHTSAARQHGVSEMQIILLDGWRESGFFSAREKAAIAWTEALTRMDRRDEAEAYPLVAAQFTDSEIIALNLLIGVINSFNRIGVGFALGHPVPVQQAA